MYFVNSQSYPPMCQIVLGDDEANAQNERGRLFVIPADASYVGGQWDTAWASVNIVMEKTGELLDATF